MGELTPEEQAEYDAFLSGANAGKVSMPIHKTARNPRPKNEYLKSFSDRIRTANLFCDRRTKSLVGVVLTSNVVATTEGVTERLGTDFWADCRCGIGHGFDGDLLLRAVLDLPERRRSARPPTIWVRHVERRDLSNM